MHEQQLTDFFDPEIQKIVSGDGCSVYKMKNATGEGAITHYGIFRAKLPWPGVLDINHVGRDGLNVFYEWRPSVHRRRRSWHQPPYE